MLNTFKKTPIFSSIIFAVLLTIPLLSSCASSQTQKNQTASAKSIEGTVTVAGQPVDSATVTLWRTSGQDPPKVVAEVSADTNGSFSIDAVSIAAIPEPADGNVFYLTTQGGTNEDLELISLGLMSVIGTELPAKVVVNELTTVASVFTNAQFIKGSAISGNPWELSIAASNMPNLVNLETGTLADVLPDPNNRTESTTLAIFNTLANLVALCGLPEKVDQCSKLLELTSSGSSKKASTLEVMQAIAKAPWKKADQIFVLFEASYPPPTPEAQRPAPHLPYLLYSPDDFALSLHFSGGAN